jgi:hypothetical protein
MQISTIMTSHWHSMNSTWAGLAQRLCKNSKLDIEKLNFKFNHVSVSLTQLHTVPMIEGRRLQTTPSSASRRLETGWRTGLPSTSRGASLLWATTMACTHREGVPSVLPEATPRRSRTLLHIISSFLMQLRWGDTATSIRWNADLLTISSPRTQKCELHIANLVQLKCLVFRICEKWSVFLFH